MFVKYHQLEVYQLAYQTALAIHKASLGFPKHEQFGGLADQIRRSSKGICANLAEGLSKTQGNKEESRFLKMARGSCEETKVWASFAKDLSYIDSAQFKHWDEAYEGISKMLYALIARRESPTP